MRRVVMDGVREFASVQDAAKYIVAQGAGKLTTVGGNISHVATRGRGTAYGHVWTYPDGKHDLVDVVRCRDCAYKRNSWNGKRPTFSDWFFCAYWGGHELTNLGGYCAWSERKVVKR